MENRREISVGGGSKRRVFVKIQLSHSFDDIISLENLLLAWREFEIGKKNRKDVQEFSMKLMGNIFSLHNDLLNHTYNHGGYQAFRISDPKPRDIHKATVRDRLLHHAIYRVLYPFFNRTFISDSFSCRTAKGTHKAINRFREFSCKVSKNNTRTCWILKCDIRKFFANIDHVILLDILEEYIPDKNILWLLKKVIESFHAKPGVGLPLGNLTSQLFVNVYMNRFDQFAKHELKAKYYIRYADDFVFLLDNKKLLEEQIKFIRKFLFEELKLELHPDKVFIKTLFSGVDFLGMVNFSDHRILRTKTKRRMLKKLRIKHEELWNGSISEKTFNQSLQSYLGILKHCRGYKVQKEIGNLIGSAGGY